MKRNKSENLKNRKGITLIALVITIIVLIILAAISLIMLSGQNGILNRAGNAQKINGQATLEEEVRRAILALQIDEKGKNDNITPDRVAAQVNSDNSRTDVTAEANTFPTNIIFPKEDAKVYVNLDLSVGKKDDSSSGGNHDVIVDGVYSEKVEESEVAPDDIFIKEVIPTNGASNNIQVASENGIDKLPSETARIKGIKPEYLYGTAYKQGDETQYGINYESIYNSDKLVIPAQVNIDGKSYKVVEVDLTQTYVEDGEQKGTVSLPNIGTIVYPNTVEKIIGTTQLNDSFHNFKKLKKVVLPENITEIPNRFFANLSVEEVKIPSSVKKIGSEAFFECKSLNTIGSISGNIGEHAFARCDNLKKVEIMEGVTSIGVWAFAGSRLTEISIPSTVEEVEDYVFQEENENFIININKPKGSLDYSNWGLRTGDKIIWNDGTTETYGE